MEAGSKRGHKKVVMMLKWVTNEVTKRGHTEVIMRFSEVVMRPNALSLRNVFECISPNKSPSGSKSAHEKSRRSLMLTEYETFCSVTPICAFGDSHIEREVVW